MKHTLVFIFLTVDAWCQYLDKEITSSTDTLLLQSVLFEEK